MPQMSPLQWEMLFIFILVMSSALLTKKFFSWSSSKIKTTSHLKPSIEDKKINWLW